MNAAALLVVAAALLPYPVPVHPAASMTVYDTTPPAVRVPISAWPWPVSLEDGCTVAITARARPPVFEGTVGETFRRVVWEVVDRAGNTVVVERRETTTIAVKPPAATASAVAPP